MGRVTRPVSDYVEMQGMSLFVHNTKEHPCSRSYRQKLCVDRFAP
jgi:hypothetical protein